MLQFAAPIGLLALGALLAPIVIHLVRRPLRVVRVGSLRLLPTERRAVRSLRWHQWLLLALRCALLAALALSLAGAAWQSRALTPVKWLLLVPGATLDQATRAEWDRLRGEGFEPRVLSSGFPRMTATDNIAPAGVDAWSLLREIDLRLPADSRVIVFGATWANQFRGARPTLINVEASWRATSSEPPADVTTVPPRVAIVSASDRDEDARYLRAAFTAIGATVVTDDAPEWIFQLGDVALPPAWSERVRQGARLVTDASNADPVVTVARWFNVGTSHVRLRQRVPVETGVPVLRDSVGAPWLTEQRQGAGTRWRFAFRFHPDWSDWPFESGFPAWWRAQFQDVINPALTVAPLQAAPNYEPKKSRAMPPLAGLAYFDLRGWFWVLAAGLFVAERAVSVVTRRQKALA